MTNSDRSSANIHQFVEAGNQFLEYSTGPPPSWTQYICALVQTWLCLAWCILSPPPPPVNFGYTLLQKVFQLKYQSLNFKLDPIWIMTLEYTDYIYWPFYLTLPRLNLDLFLTLEVIAVELV